MMLNKLLPDPSVKYGDEFITGMLKNAFHQIDHLESQLADAEEQLRVYGKVLAKIAKGAELEEKGYISIYHTFFPGDDGYQLIKDVFNLKEKEENPED